MAVFTRKGQCKWSGHPLAVRETSNLNRVPTSEGPRGPQVDVLPRERYRYVQRITNLFWDLWKKQYLQSLVTRKKWTEKTRNLETGDFVLLIDKNVPRGQWNTGHATKTYPGADKLVRVVDVETSHGVYRRAIHTLCLLELKETNGNTGNH